MGGGGTSQDVMRLGQARRPPKQRQVHPPPPRFGKDGRPPSLVQRRIGNNLRASDTDIRQGGESGVSTHFGGCACCISYSGLYIFHM